MEGAGEDNTDNSSLKPVSSLRSHFEGIIKSKPPPPPLPSPSLGASRNLTVNTNEPYSRGASLDIPRSSYGFSGTQKQGYLKPDAQQDTAGSRSGTPKLRPMSMGPLSPPRSPPLVTVDSPNSPPKLSGSSRNSPFVSTQGSHESLPKPSQSRSSSPTSGMTRPFKIPSRTQTPSLDTRQVPALTPTPTHISRIDPDKPPSPDLNMAYRSSPAPPPINRAGKPKLFGTKSSTLESRSIGDSLAPNMGLEKEEERVSPFSTPPSEPEDVRNDSSSTPPQVPSHSKPRMNSASRPIRDTYFVSPTQTISESPPEMASPSSDTNWTERIKFANRSDPSSTPKTTNWIESMKLPTRSIPSIERQSPQSTGDRPSLPPRHENGTTPVRNNSPPRSRRPPPPPPPSEPPLRKSMDVLSSRSSFQANDGPGRASMDTTRSLVAESAKFQPPPRRIPPPSQSIATPSNSGHAPIPPSRPSADMRRAEIPSRSTKPMHSVDDSEEDESELPVAHGATLAEYPDSSQANRRPPRFQKRPHDIPTKYETKLFAICGETICTSGYITKVWNILTGELLMEVKHGETVKVTAVAFKPAASVDDEGKRLWLGTNTGELHEIDIPTQNTIANHTQAHSRIPVTKIHRSGSEMWTLDDQGTLLVWPAGEDGLPSLNLQPYVSRLPKDLTFSIIVGSQLWVAIGKEIWVYQHHPSNGTTSLVFNKPLVQQHVGEVTAAATITSRPDLIYFGHQDGKVTMYNLKNYSCTGVVNVSLYKISCLVGVGDYLWAGFNTGMIYVYDTSSFPWKVQKDWKAHESTIAGILVDRTSIWKLDRLQVASLGTDSHLKIWDGMLEQDWLEIDMQKHDTEYCDFRELTALVMTWNAGATKPTHLRHDEQDSNFFRDLLRGPREPPDFVVFGFQELVDLEDKKVTAKNLFKSSKKKDHSEKEHMAKQYRAWRDHLSSCLDQYMPSREPYTLLHTADLVGLFQCVFVKTSLRSSISDVDGAQVKLGMGGRYGNKGALIVRFLLDDSSVCFINCHLAAGQRQTVHRNNDVASIMESSALQARYDAQTQLDMFVSGGDGSMVLDHEICILNGDLNYRIDAMSRDIVIREIQAGNLQRLLEKDQLLLSRKRNPGFRLRAFQEKEITFPPTYKYDVGSDQYDSSEKKRSPAWCDRLLYRGMGNIKQTEYQRHEVRVSDHRPVSGMFRIRAKTIDRKRQTTARQRSEERFEEVRRRIAMDIKLDYLVSVLGLSRKEAERSLKR